ncbi:hypothetical protein ZWY2020_014577 [Hordeum vulgare]|nr:hypothetical protein ZWY2020_014577 [Hordeum vulgare]
MCYGLYFAAKKLKQYFQEDTITVVSMAPLLEIMVDIVLSSLKGDQLKYALHIHFAASNNVAEYEALVHGLRLAKEIGIRRILCFGDSDLMGQEVSGEWDARDANMASYRFLVQQLTDPLRAVSSTMSPGRTMRRQTR